MKTYRNSELNARAVIAELSDIQERIAALKEMLQREELTITNNGVMVDNETIAGFLYNAIGDIEQAVEEILYTE